MNCDNAVIYTAVSSFESRKNKRHEKRDKIETTFFNKNEKKKKQKKKKTKKKTIRWWKKRQVNGIVTEFEHNKRMKTGIIANRILYCQSSKSSSKEKEKNR
jgi:hypothetical protein